MNKQAIKRATRMRNKIKAVNIGGRPRLSVHRTNVNLYAQIIDDATQCTLVSTSTLDKAFKDLNFKGNGIEIAGKIGEILATKAMAAGVSKVVFDKGSYAYHGRVKQLAEKAREIGLVF